VTFNRAALTALATTLALAAGPAAAQAKTETDTEGQVKASFSYTSNKDKTQFKNLKLDIERNGALLLRTTLPKYKDFWPGGAVDNSSVDVRDLDGDGEPEVLVKLYSGGANCCLSALVYRYRAATNGYSPLRFDTGHYGFNVKNLDRKGPPEIVTNDVRFQGAFNTVTADQRAPIRILRLKGGRLANVTREFPGELRKDIRQLKKDYPQYVRMKANRRGILATLAADYLTLNDSDGTVRTFKKIEVLYGREFSGRLKLFLARRGYKLQN
jgi:hypothetical protein